jgi:hypothetical protein
VDAGRLGGSMIKTLRVSLLFLYKKNLTLLSSDPAHPTPEIYPIIMPAFSQRCPIPGLSIPPAIIPVHLLAVKYI